MDRQKGPVDRRRYGRRAGDHATTEGQTTAAAQSVVQARLDGGDPAPSTAPQAAKAYAELAHQPTAAEMRRAAFMAEAQVALQSANRAWARRRRIRDQTQPSQVEDAVIV